MGFSIAGPVVSLLVSLMAGASPSGPGRQTVARLFAADEPLTLTLSADFDQLKKDRSEDSEERPGEVRIVGSGGTEVSVPVQVRTRGNFRLQRRICSDPPLRLNFAETNPQGTVFDGQDKLKLVTHCRDSDRYEQNLLEEYLAYRIYNQLTDRSFRVRLAKITYQDTSGRNDPVERMAFLIEDDEALAARLGGRMVEAPTTRPEDFVLDQLSLMYLFQLMVGNVDWSTGYSHNVQILYQERGYYPIPYDFDWSGLVDAPYSGPNELTEPFHDSVRERLYWGACLPGIDYPGLFARFLEEREAILDLARNLVGLSERNVEWAVDYLEEFFDIIGDDRRADRAIVRACRSTR